MDRVGGGIDCGATLIAAASISNECGRFIYSLMHLAGISPDAECAG
jgi:hypothetical protein